MYASWTARIPALKAYFGVSNAGMGTLLFTTALGALLAMPFTGILAERIGTRRLTRFNGVLFCLWMPMLLVSPSPVVAGLVYFVMGLTAGSLDVAMNGQAVELERRWHEPIMSSFHALFSVGMAAGAGVGALFARYAPDMVVHFMLIGGLGALAALWAGSQLPPEAAATPQKSETPHFQLPTRAILPLGIIAFCGMTGEGAMADWSALFMHKVVGATEAFSAYAIGTFAVAMTIGRVFGDAVTARVGRYNLLILDSLLAIVGLTVLLAFASVWSTLAGLFCIGLGLATVVPIIYSSAGNMPGVSPSVGIAMATTIGYAGFFVGPPAIGFLADGIGLRWALGFVWVLFVVMLFLNMQQKAKASRSIIQ